MRRLVWLFTLAACVDASTVEPQVTSGVVQKQLPVLAGRAVDLLFVVDNSPAMIEHQARLHTNMRHFVTALHTLEGGLPDLRIGVTTTDLGGDGCSPGGDDGRFRGDPEVIGNFLVDYVGPDGVRLRNYQGELADVLARIADVGTSGCPHTQPIAAARRALENYANRSFLRDDSTLGVFLISALDAPDDVATLDATAQFFRSIYGDPARVVAAGILGDLDPSARIPQFLDRFPHRNARVSIDQPNWSNVLSPFTSLLTRTLGVPCFEESLLDVDPIAPGAQYACAAWYEFPVGGEVIPSCESAFAGPCWRLAADPQWCPQAQHLFVKIEQPRADVPADSHVHVECLSR